MRKFANIQAVWAQPLIKYWILDCVFVSSDSVELLPVVMGENSIIKMFNLKFYRSDLISHNTASCKEENWVNKEEKSQYWEHCYVAAFTALCCLLHNLLYWAEKTVFIQSYPTKLWILTRKSFIEQNKMLVLSILTYLTPNTIYYKLEYQMALVLNLKWEWKNEILFDFIWRINMSKNSSVPWSSTVSQWV